MYSQNDTQIKRIRAYRRQAAADALKLSATQVDRLVKAGRIATAPVDVIDGPDLIDAESLHAELRRRGLPVPGEIEALA